MLFYASCGLIILFLRSYNPPVTAVRMERHVEAAIAKRPYHAQHFFVPSDHIAPDLKYAVIAAEDGRFFLHHGFDWMEMRKVVQDDLAKHTVGRGASTITQQLVKNLFLGTERSFLRKGVEFTLVPMVELMLSKDRILELYLNEIEWGPGIYGVQAAAEHWYGVPASALSRDQSARLAAIIPNPLRRHPDGETEYAEEIEARMTQMGW